MILGLATLGLKSLPCGFGFALALTVMYLVLQLSLAVLSCCDVCSLGVALAVLILHYLETKIICQRLAGVTATCKSLADKISLLLKSCNYCPSWPWLWYNETDLVLRKCEIQLGLYDRFLVETSCKIKK